MTEFINDPGDDQARQERIDYINALAEIASASDTVTLALGKLVVKDASKITERATPEAIGEYVEDITYIAAEVKPQEALRDVESLLSMHGAFYDLTHPLEDGIADSIAETMAFEAQKFLFHLND